MAHFHNASVITQDPLITIKLWYTVGGLYIWEFVTTLEYEWNVIRGRLPYRWTIWIYSLARVAALLGLILLFFLMDNTSPINCQVAYSFLIILCTLFMSASTLLIVLRVIAIWNGHKVVLAVAIGVWGIDVGFLIRGAARIRGAWVPAQLACVSSNYGSVTPNLVISMLVTDISLLLIMLCGLFRLRRHCDGVFGLTQLLWKQGVTWFLVATIARVPPAVLVVSDLNGPFSIMLQTPAWIIMAIAATRMHRSLVDFASRSTDVVIVNLPNNLPVPETKQRSAASSLIDRIEVVFDIVSQQHVTPRMKNDALCAGTDKHTRDKPNRLGHDDDMGYAA